MDYTAAEMELFRRAGETSLDAWMLLHPYIVLFGIPGLCLFMSFYVLWATDPRMTVMLSACAHHRGGRAIKGKDGRVVRFGRVLHKLLEVAIVRIRLNVTISHGLCVDCANLTDEQLDRLAEESRLEGR